MQEISIKKTEKGLSIKVGGDYAELASMLAKAMHENPILLLLISESLQILKGEKGE